MDTGGVCIRHSLPGPDPTAHRNVSFIKSALRILAGVSLAFGNVIMAGASFVVAEALGIVEELV